ncbi:unnamed protein product [Trichogramma brassicae]|uniref:Uncharacterized protein n=1 Tax=Trichogramma brassicae TaxID=86971 RepID=A0A6H5I632_9HYME|nr:unnamed protein product [Trichogramma brassicae]
MSRRPTAQRLFINPTNVFFNFFVPTSTIEYITLNTDDSAPSFFNHRRKSFCFRASTFT